jgi:predicted ester cyclase
VKSEIDGVNSHNVNQAVEFDAESIVDFDPGHPQGVVGKAVEVQGMIALFAAFPDIQFLTEQILGVGDWVALKGVLTGTSTGPLKVGKRRVKPTFRRFSSRRTVFHKFQDGKIVESHAYFDPREIPVQLGFISRNVNRTLLLIFVGLGIMTYQTLFVTFLLSNSGISSIISPSMLLFGFFLGMLTVLLGILSLRRGLIQLR